MRGKIIIMIPLGTPYEQKHLQIAVQFINTLIAWKLVHFINSARIISNQLGFLMVLFKVVGLGLRVLADSINHMHSQPVGYAPL